MRVYDKMSHDYLDDVVDLRDETVHANLHQHDQSTAHILPNLGVFIVRQEKQILKRYIRSSRNNGIGVQRIQ